jgi:hypothetical protein
MSGFGTTWVGGLVSNVLDLVEGFQVDGDTFLLTTLQQQLTLLCLIVLF